MKPLFGFVPWSQHRRRAQNSDNDKTRNNSDKFSEGAMGGSIGTLVNNQTDKDSEGSGMDAGDHEMKGPEECSKRPAHMIKSGAIHEEEVKEVELKEEEEEHEPASHAIETFCVTLKHKESENAKLDGYGFSGTVRVRSGSAEDEKDSGADPSSSLSSVKCPTKAQTQGKEGENDEVQTDQSSSVVKGESSFHKPNNATNQEDGAKNELVSSGPTLEDEIKGAIERSLADEQFDLEMEKLLSQHLEKAVVESVQQHEISFAASEDEHQSHETMISSTLGRAWILCRRMMDLHERWLEGESPDVALYKEHVNVVPVDNMVMMAKNFLDCQEYFAQNDVPSLVTIGYHYTTRESLESIKQRGLLTPRDQRLLNITVERRLRSDAFGRGVYLGSNPFAFNGYGDGVGLMVAMVTGKTRRVASGTEAEAEAKHHNTVVGNKGKQTGLDTANDDRTIAVGHFSDEFVLQESSQCLPLFSFQRNLIELSNHKPQHGNDLLWKMHETVQSTLDELVNRGVKTDLVRILPSHRGELIGGLCGVALPPDVQGHTTSIDKESTSLCKQERILPPIPYSGFQSRNQALISLLSPMDDAILETYEITYTAPDSLDSLLEETTQESDFTVVDTASQEYSSICSEPLGGDPSKDASHSCCNHVNHHECIHSTAAKGEIKTTNTATACPVCRQQNVVPSVAAPRLGKSPSGKMFVTRTSSMCCAGYEDSTNQTIVIEYTIFRGVQKSYHPCPGSSIHAIRRNAYLPDNEEGRRALHRLAYAWMHGMTFTVIDCKSGDRTVDLTPSIPHKESVEYGYPDEHYFENLDRALDSLGIPNWLECTAMHLMPHIV